MEKKQCTSLILKSLNCNCLTGFRHILLDATNCSAHYKILHFNPFKWLEKKWKVTSFVQTYYHNDYVHLWLYDRHIVGWDKEVCISSWRQEKPSLDRFLTKNASRVLDNNTNANTKMSTSVIVLLLEKPNLAALVVVCLRYYRRTDLGSFQTPTWDTACSIPANDILENVVCFFYITFR